MRHLQSRGNTVTEKRLGGRMGLGGGRAGGGVERASNLLATDDAAAAAGDRNIELMMTYGEH